ncbi:MAG: M20/M25/M40 family metallo-hydrolase [Alphaproteobacteria bacterium]|nr:M20/M25/M40 family metallo-hydrolase [Alphaproteobacteria bacterium]MBU1512517.1 M20/M25/M40 family metallo-hydrolase [Alphaproteobacteria bacterium]MBU2092856.1 M20/M25/M40 family metallo-hydrolase [Alphaproteobacteria bacterium]MBU2149640.1 M20/M25/M40 family metallo-hydrolase [Alphaproteobacteria bacterium]MBU2306852.1 M20/M25/M40 family metallo-hydrolase [Alphaproteobacteria bacterium]
MRLALSVAAAVAALAGAAHAEPAAPLRADQVAFRALYKELVETNTTLSVGSCTEAAAKMGARLTAAGFKSSELTYFAVPERPKEGGLVAILTGSDPKAGAVLLLGHLDVVEARREDWTRDPFTLFEEDGYFYGRGTVDMKVIDAVWVDTLARLKASGKVPRRTLKMALTCGEESNQAFNGADWLVRNRPDLVIADFGLNEGGTGLLDFKGQRLQLLFQAGEKATQDFRLTVTNPGGHSSRPRADNAIYQLADALQKVHAYAFPTRFTPTTRALLAQRAALGDPAGKALQRLMADPSDAAAARAAQADPAVNSITHTTCVPTLLAAGHAQNALPQSATANVNCRIFPGETIAETRDTLVRVIGDASVKVEATNPDKPLAVPPPLDPKVIEPMRTTAAKHFPGVPLNPMMLPGATDGVYFGKIGMPIYGVPGLFTDPDGNGLHGLNERVRTSSVYAFRDYMFDLVTTYAGQSATGKSRPPS